MRPSLILPSLILVTSFIILSLYCYLTKDWLLLMFLCGIWCIGDGVFSICLYSNQTLVEHMPRLLRLITGFYLIFITHQMRLTF